MQVADGEISQPATGWSIKRDRPTLDPTNAIHGNQKDCIRTPHQWNDR